MMILVVLITLLSLLTFHSAETCPTNNCAECKGNSVCDSCDDGYYLEAGACTQCPIQCLQCTHSLICQSCVKSYWNPGRQCTSPCPADCSRGDCDDDGNCYECELGKYGPDCDRDCTLCRNEECDLYKCTQGCKDGFLQWDTGSGYSDCYSCSDNCITCSNTTYCTECDQGFYTNYFRNPTTGRGNMWCMQCHEECTRCTSIDQCPEWCHIDCIKQGCDVSGICATTPSTSHTRDIQTPAHTNAPETMTQPKSTTPTPSTPHTTCPDECTEGCDVHGKCLDTTTRNSESDEPSCKCTDTKYYEAFGHGIATGISIAVAVGALIGIVVYLRTRICHAKPSTDSREKHVYVNTQERNNTQPVSTDRPDYDNVEANSEIRVTMSEQDVDADREYTSIGERQPEHHYSDLQAN